MWSSRVPSVGKASVANWGCGETLYITISVDLSVLSDDASFLVHKNYASKYLR